MVIMFLSLKKKQNNSSINKAILFEFAPASPAASSANIVDPGLVVVRSVARVIDVGVPIIHVNLIVLFRKKIPNL